MALDMIRAAAKAGADYVKFQTFVPEEVMSRYAPKAEYQETNTGDSGSQIEMVRPYALNEDDHRQLIAECQEQGIGFMSSAFDLPSIELLHRLGQKIWKVPSGEITNLPYLRLLGHYAEHVILSTGMATLGDIEQGLATLESTGLKRSQITILHCHTDYPTAPEYANLRAMRTLRLAFGTAVGLSDHTVGIAVGIAAAAMGAAIIEKHFTLDRALAGPDHVASMTPDELAQLVDGCRTVALALGNGIKQPTEKETAIAGIARKSLHARAGLKAGHILTADDLAIKRPNFGIPSNQLDMAIGRKLRRDIAEDYWITWADLD